MITIIFIIYITSQKIGKIEIQFIFYITILHFLGSILFVYSFTDRLYLRELTILLLGDVFAICKSFCFILNSYRKGIFVF